MYRILIAMTAWLAIVPLFAQQGEITQDPAAGKILDRVSEQFARLKSVQADFELIIEDRKENMKNASSGNLLIKKDKYRITSPGSTVCFDGKTMWTYMEEEQEVTITEPGEDREDLLSNPARLFAGFHKDFKYRYVRETTLKGAKYDEIDLFPMDLDQPYSRIKVFVGQKSGMPEIISSVGKDGVDYTVNLTGLQLDRDIPDAVFTFDTLKYKKVEVIDMRGVK